MLCKSGKIRWIITNFDDIATDTLDEWIYFLKNEEIKENFHAKGLLEAKEKLDILKLSPSEKAAYELHISKLRREASLYESSYVSGKLEGREEGREAAKEEVATNLLSLGLLSDEQIALSAGLTVERIGLLRSRKAD